MRKMLGIGSEGHDAHRIAEELGLLYISYQAGCPSTNHAIEESGYQLFWMAQMKLLLNTLHADTFVYM